MSRESRVAPIPTPVPCRKPTDPPVFRPERELWSFPRRCSDAPPCRRLPRDGRPPTPACRTKPAGRCRLPPLPEIALFRGAGNHQAHLIHMGGKQQPPVRPLFSFVRAPTDCPTDRFPAPTKRERHAAPPAKYSRTASSRPETPSREQRSRMCSSKVFILQSPFRQHSRHQAGGIFHIRQADHLRRGAYNAGGWTAGPWAPRPGGGDIIRVGSRIVSPSLPVDKEAPAAWPTLPTDRTNASQAPAPGRS